uniref:Ribosomal protein L13 n=1 Tax=Kumanoa americana TaxID=1196377 RepID=A0A1C9CGT1_9FLOR|nr:ribosomal protein L13 [Kumanoa americana]AOM67610.1 ribosomal protein L13 [Kumanoa americana]
MNKTYMQHPYSAEQWYLIDAQGKTLGRIATQIAYILKGKHNSLYTPYLDCGNNIVVINTAQINVSGQKRYQKIYYRHSGRPGGLKKETFEQLQNRLPNRIIEKSVKNMLPKGPLGKKLLRKLKAYPNNVHPHTAQNPKIINIM